MNLIKPIKFIINFLKTILNFVNSNNFISIIISSLIAFFLTNKQRKKQNKYEDAKILLPILLEILEDLEILEYVYIFSGEYCPIIEHRAPKLSNDDGDGANNASYAQRSHQFRLIGRKIIKNCSRIIFFTSKKNLSKTVIMCKKIKEYLTFKENPNSKTHLDKKITELMHVLAGKSNEYAALKTFAEELRQFHDDLDTTIEQELPSLSQ